MSQSKEIINVFKQSLKAKGFTYKQLANKVGLSESSLKRILSGDNIDLKKLEQFCSHLNITITDLVKNLAAQENKLANFYTTAQEEALVKNPRLLHFFTLILDGVSVKKIKSEFEITPIEVEKYLITLDKINIIELYPEQKFKFLIARDAKFQKDGPLGKKLFEVSRKEFLEYPFKSENSFLRMRTLKLDKISIEKLKSRFEKLLREVQDESEWNKEHAYDEIGILLAFRPWKFTIFESLKRRN